MNRTARGWCLLATLAGGALACGGSARRSDRPEDSVAPGGAGGAGEDDAGAAGDAPLSNAGAASAGGSGGSSVGGELGVAGQSEAGAGSPPLDGSGTSLCVEDWECPKELPCTSAVGTTQRACVTACTSDEGCLAAQRCVSSSSVSGSCFPRCEWPWDCSFGFDCVLPAGRSEYVCVPLKWATSFITGN